MLWRGVKSETAAHLSGKSNLLFSCFVLLFKGFLPTDLSWPLMGFVLVVLAQRKFHVSNSIRFGCFRTAGALLVLIIRGHGAGYGKSICDAGFQGRCGFPPLLHDATATFMIEGALLMHKSTNAFKTFCHVKRKIFVPQWRQMIAALFLQFFC